MLLLLLACASNPSPRKDVVSTSMNGPTHTKQPSNKVITGEEQPLALKEERKEQPALRFIGALEMPVDSGFKAAPMGRNVPSMHQGDRLWLSAEAPTSDHLYAISVFKQSQYRIIWTSQPNRNETKTALFPNGLEITKETLAMDTLLLVSSKEPIAWLTDNKSYNCETWRNKMPPKKPSDACGFLHGLHWIKPGRVRGPGSYPREKVQLLTQNGTALTAAVGAGSGKPIVVAELQFSPKSTNRP